LLPPQPLLLLPPLLLVALGNSAMQRASGYSIFFSLDAVSSEVS